MDGVVAAAVAVGAGACDSRSVISWCRECWLARRKCAEPGKKPVNVQPRKRGSDGPRVQGAGRKVRVRYQRPMDGARDTNVNAKTKKGIETFWL